MIVSFYNARLSEPKKLENFFTWDFSKNPHGLIIGGERAGKTYFLKLIASRIASRHTSAEFYIIQPDVPESFYLYQVISHYYRGQHCVKGIDAVYSKYKARVYGYDTTTTEVFLILDEYNEFSDQRDVARTAMVTEMLDHGDIYNIHLLISNRDIPGYYFPENTMRIALGDFSYTTALALFSGRSGGTIYCCNLTGLGYISDEHNYYKLIVPANYEVIDYSLIDTADQCQETEGLYEKLYTCQDTDNPADRIWRNSDKNAES